MCVGQRGGRTGRGASSGNGKFDMSARVLSSSKICEAPVRNESKGAGKSKGAGRKGKGRGTSKFQPSTPTPVVTEPVVSIYLGCISTKRIYQVVAFGDQVERLRPYVGLDNKPLVNVTQLQIRPGKEELLCTSETVFTTCIEPMDDASAGSFCYAVEEVSKHLATKAFVDQTLVGSIVDLVLLVNAVEEKEIKSGDNMGNPYLLVAGVDMEGQTVGPLRVWEHVWNDVREGNIYIIRGLKVVIQKQWDEVAGRYVNNTVGLKTLDCDSRTAIEDVNDNEEIASYFL